jgi:hypothetical protein
VDEQLRLADDELAKKHKDLDQLVAASAATQEEAIAKRKQLDEDIRTVEADLTEKRKIFEGVTQDVIKLEQDHEVRYYRPSVCSSVSVAHRYLQAKVLDVRRVMEQIRLERETLDEMSARLKQAQATEKSQVQWHQ